MREFKKWKIVRSEPLFQSKYVSFRKDQCLLPDGRLNPHYYVMEFADWVTVIAVTTENKFLMVRQYRHASQETFMEFPGGTSDGEDPMEAGQRELLEETGFKAGKMECVGVHYPNPALQNNRLHTFIAWDCEKVDEQRLDAFEDIEIIELEPSTLNFMIQKGEFSHSLMLASLMVAQESLKDLL